jgi:hypothetical protein
MQLLVKYEGRQIAWEFNHFPATVSTEGLRLEIQSIDSYRIICELTQTVLIDNQIIQKPFAGVVRKIGFPINLS